MQLKKLSIINYKNIQTATLDLSPKLNCFIGHNGEGKTNLLDAVYYLSFCKSAFNPKDSEVMRHNADYFVLEGDYSTDAGEHEQVYCGMKRGSKSISNEIRKNINDCHNISDSSHSYLFLLLTQHSSKEEVRSEGD